MTLDLSAQGWTSLINGIIAALLVDICLMRIGIALRWWWRLRALLSIGLGGLTIALGLLSA